MTGEPLSKDEGAGAKGPAGTDFLHEGKFVEALLESIPGILYVYDDQGRLVKWNKKHEELTGYSAEELSRTTSEGWHPMEERAMVAQAVEEVMRTGHGEVEAHLLLKDGGSVLMQFNGMRLDLDGKAYFTGVGIDITERRRIEDALRASEGWLKYIVSAMHVGVLLQGPKAEILLCNPKALELLGLTEDQLLGRTSFDPAWNVSHEDGSPFPGPTHPVPRAIAEGRPMLGVVMGVYRPDKGGRVWLSVDAEPQLDMDGRVARVVCSFTDITARKAAEDSLQRAFEENRILLGELQHRAKNSFNLISGMVSMAAGASASAEVKAALEDLEARVRSVSDLYSLLYSAGTFTTVRLDQYCERIAKSLVGLNGHVDLVAELEALAAPVKNAAAIGLVLTELVTNSLKYAFPGGRKGRIYVSLTKVEGGARLSVRDDGVGMVLAEGDGRGGTGGMGLSLVRGLAGQLVGDFKMESGEGGTTCLLEFRFPGVAGDGA